MDSRPSAYYVFSLHTSQSVRYFYPHFIDSRHRGLVFMTCSDRTGVQLQPMRLAEALAVEGKAGVGALTTSVSLAMGQQLV